MNLTIDPFSDLQLETICGWSLFKSKQDYIYLLKENSVILILGVAQKYVLELALKSGIEEMTYAILDDVESLTFKTYNEETIILTNAEAEESMASMFIEETQSIILITPDTMYLAGNQPMPVEPHESGLSFEIIHFP